MKFDAIDLMGNIGTCTGVCALATFDVSVIASVLLSMATIVCALATLLKWAIKIFDAVKNYIKGKKTAEETAKELETIVNDIETERNERK